MVHSRAIDRTYSRVRSVGFLMHRHRAVEHLSRCTAMMGFCILLKVGCESLDLSTVGGTQKYEYLQSLKAVPNTQLVSSSSMASQVSALLRGHPNGLRSRGQRLCSLKSSQTYEFWHLAMTQMWSVSLAQLDKTLFANTLKT